MNKFMALLNHQFKELGRPLVMGILNVTPDSFSDGGRFNRADAMKSQIEEMVSAGVDIIDIGGESTRPGAPPVSLQEELDRVLPALEWVKENSDVAVSIDTYKTEVMRQTLLAGADLINDVNALQAEGALEVVSQADVPVCIMHKQGDPQTMQIAPRYDDVVADVSSFLEERVQACRNAGVKAEHILIDPGFGFGKTLEHNIALFRRLDRFAQGQYPVLVGVSRKTMIGALMGDVPVAERMVGSVVAAVVAAQKGAAILRVHDVKETVQALSVAEGLCD
ncbi:dihydropteroate synthase [Thiomicrorhabdus sp. zzn3]|uniref:dihydropteroate synthase n=1 Tax=Thiomicrorhabdus sp. zzn3 TaxID=3039775 RepID=UPI0024368E28|nr:dihydropteroate synthase [Thiomicrorhabdus sp. zzn3]MDG6778337.1 dihydropteroate synthase [Thiomicrorhabdus sp. zzn3]